jgi:hypothetical protein
MIHRIISEDEGFEPDAFEISAADVNLDGKVTQEDLEQVMDRAVGKIYEFRQEWNYGGGEVPLIDEPSLDFVFMDQSWSKFNTRTRISETYPDDDGKGFSRHRTPGLNSLAAVGYTDGTPFPNYKNSSIDAIALGDLDGSMSSFREDASTQDTIYEDPELLYMSGDTIIHYIRLGNTSSGNSVHLVFQGMPPAVKGSLESYEPSSIIVDPDAVYRYHTRGEMTRVSVYHPGGFSGGDTLARILYTGENSIMGFEVALFDTYLDGEKVQSISLLGSSSIEETGMNEALRVYPNPAGSQVNVRLDHTYTGPVSLEILDMTGRVVVHSREEKSPGSQTYTLDLGTLDGGTYVLKLGLGSETTLVRKLIRE